MHSYFRLTYRNYILFASHVIVRISSCESGIAIHFCCFSRHAPDVNETIRTQKNCFVLLQCLYWHIIINVCRVYWNVLTLLVGFGQSKKADHDYFSFVVVVVFDDSNQWRRRRSREMKPNENKENKIWRKKIMERKTHRKSTNIIRLEICLCFNIVHTN